MAKIGFVVVTPRQKEWVRQQFGKEYSERMHLACRKVGTNCRNRGLSEEETDKCLRRTCLKIASDFSRNGDPRLHTAGDHPSTRTVI